MSFWNRLRGVFSPQANSITMSEDLARVLHRMSFGSSSAGVDVNINKAQGLPAVSRAVQLLSDTIANVPCELMRERRNADGRLVSEPVYNDPRYTLLYEQANERETAFQFKAMLQADMELRGVAYALKVRGVGNRVIELMRLHPDCVVAKEEDDGTVYFEHTTPRGKRERIERENMLWMLRHSDDGLTPKSTITRHRETLGEALALQTESGKFHANGLKSSVALTIPNGVKIGDEAIKAMRGDFSSLYEGSENAYKVPFLPGGIEPKTLSISQRDAQYIETRVQSIGDIARIFGVPPHKLHELSRATFSNIEEQNLEFVNDAMRPRARFWTEVLTRDVLDGDRSLEYRFNFNELLKGKAFDRAQANAIRRQNGVINANEWREEDLLNPREDDGGEQYVIQLNMVGGRAPTTEELQAEKQQAAERSQNSAEQAGNERRAELLALQARIDALIAQEKPAPQITVNVPETKAPDVSVNVEAPHIVVNPQAEAPPEPIIEQPEPEPEPVEEQAPDEPAEDEGPVVMRVTKRDDQGRILELEKFRANKKAEITQVLRDGTDGQIIELQQRRL